MTCGKFERAAVAAMSDAVYHLILIGYAADLLISNFALVPTDTKTSYAARSQP